MRSVENKQFIILSVKYDPDRLSVAVKSVIMLSVKNK
jgi:hypothetical protein